MQLLGGGMHKTGAAMEYKTTIRFDTGWPTPAVQEWLAPFDAKSIWEEYRRVSELTTMPQNKLRRGFERLEKSVAKTFEILDAFGKRASTGKTLNVFIVSALSHFNNQKGFSYNNEMINAIDLILTFRYGMQVEYALRNNEGVLPVVRKEYRDRLCYEFDIDSVERADLIVAILTHPSQGLGQEIQHAAYQAGVPIIGISQKTVQTQIRLKYSRLEAESEEVVDITLYKSRGGTSAMVAGNPAMFPIVIYPQDTLSKNIMQRLDNACWRAQYRVDEKKRPKLYRFMKENGRKLHEKLEKENPRSIALRSLDDALQNYLGLVPVESFVKQEHEFFKGLKANGNEAEIKEKIHLLERRVRMQKNLLFFHPICRNRNFKDYSHAWPAFAPPYDRVMGHEFSKYAGNGKKLNEMKQRNG